LRPNVDEPKAKGQKAKAKGGYKGGSRGLFEL